MSVTLDFKPTFQYFQALYSVVRFSLKLFHHDIHNSSRYVNFFYDVSGQFVCNCLFCSGDCGLFICIFGDFDRSAHFTVDLNSDLGEGFGPWTMGDDAAMLDIVTSANIACGGHAGDPSIMRKTCAAAVERGVRIGAHVGYRDLAGFGRRAIAVSVASVVAASVVATAVADVAVAIVASVATTISK